MFVMIFKKDIYEMRCFVSTSECMKEIKWPNTGMQAKALKTQDYTDT